MTLPVPPEVEAWETHRRAVVRYWPNRREKCPPHDQLDVRLDLADSALAARTRQAEELTAHLSALTSPPEDHPGEWWCPFCEEWVPGQQVTYGEQHEICGHHVTDHNPFAVAEAERQASEAAEARVKELERQATQLEHDKAECMEAARGANEALGDVQADNERLRSEVERLTKERDEALDELSEWNT